MVKLTQKAIIQTFLNILQQKSLDKITVKDIIETAGINRNTFYYYYDDIYDLIDQIFKEETKNVLLNTTENYTFYEEYVRAASLVIENKQAIIHIYHSKSKDILFNYLEQVTSACVKKFVIKAAKDYDLSEDGIEYITYFYSNAIVGSTMHWVRNGMDSYRDDLLKRMSNSFEATIDDMIKDFVKSEH